MEVSNPSSQKKIIKLWNKVDESLYRETMEQYLEGHTNLINTNAIKYFTKAVKAATDKVVPASTIKPSVKPRSFNAAIKPFIAESKEIHWKWEKEGKP